MMAVTIHDRLCRGLKDMGAVELPKRNKYTTFRLDPTDEPPRYYFVGKAGALRVAARLSVATSIPCRDRFRQEGAVRGSWNVSFRRSLYPCCPDITRKILICPDICGTLPLDRHGEFCGPTPEERKAMKVAILGIFEVSGNLFAKRTLAVMAWAMLAVDAVVFDLSAWAWSN